MSEHSFTHVKKSFILLAQDISQDYEGSLCYFISQIILLIAILLEVSMQIGRNLLAMEWTHLYWPDLSRASVRSKPQSGSFIYSVEPEAIGHCLIIDALVSWVKEAKMKQAKRRISEVSNSRGMGLNFQMTLKPILNVTQSLRWSLGRKKRATETPQQWVPWLWEDPWH